MLRKEICVLLAKDIPARTSVSVSDAASLLSSTNSLATNIDVAVTSLSPCRPTVNSLLHLLGSWLLEASLVGVHVYGHDNKGEIFVIIVISGCFLIT